MTHTVVSKSPEQTQALAKKIGQTLRGGETLELISDIGGGKTTFVRGLAHGAGSTSHVSSPTFKISNTYKTPRFDIVHFDFYRMDSAELIQHELAEVVNDENSVVLVEWSDLVAHVLPDKRVRVRISPTGTDSRQIKFEYPKSLQYLVDTL